ncbi:unnamed protein product [Ambrosiozyma monospora]|uniref:Unnamed protein product n=1 Tax=Ambrosiozyma monospora TaxID=43982 RepID=A0ACB5SZE2_AMBMO|nr:unnamed protein product [Ambrosiozyma monospora]
MSEGGVKELDIPIVAFPPFKLRSSLIDKDPVIWQFLLEDYITLFKKLILITQSKDFKLSVKTTQQLSSFMKIYLSEVSQESTRIFSLGAINPDIITNQKHLKLIIFKFIKSYNLINLKIGGDSIWNFLKIYLRLALENATANQSLINVNVVRDLVDGTIKSKLNSRSDDISLIRVLQDHLKLLISETKFDRSDLETLTMLLGQKYQRSLRNQPSNKQRNIKGRRQGGNGGGTEFSERFVTGHWIQILEELYNGGESIHSKTVFEIMVVCLISLPSAKILNLISKEFNINNKSQMVKLYPLLSKIVFSKKFNDMNPDFKEKAKFLNKTAKRATSSYTSSVRFDQSKIKTITEMFPQLNDKQVKTILLEYNHDVDACVMQLLENPDNLNNVKEYQEKTTQKKSTKSSKSTKQQATKQAKPATYQRDDKTFKVQFGKKERDTKLDITPDEQNLKQSILNSALRLLYESDEDEPDDTYNDQEVTTASGKLAITDAAAGEEFDNAAKVNKKLEEEHAKIEQKLFQIYKTDPNVLARGARYSNYRQQLKAELKWTDEQIEGWARMLEKSPKRFRMLEQQYINVDTSLNRNLKPRTKYTKPDDEESEEDGNGKKKPQGTYAKEKSHKNFNSYMDKKKQAANKSKNKASRGNHNRKSGHDKKIVKMGP